MTWMIYLIGISDNVRCSFTFFAVILGIASIALTASKVACICSGDTDIQETFRKFPYKTILFGFFLSVFIALSIPEKKWIIAMYTVPKIAQNEKIQNIGNMTSDALTLYLQNCIDDLKGSTSTNSLK